MNGVVSHNLVDIVFSSFPASGEPPQCMTSAIIFALKRSIIDAREEIGNKDFFPLCMLFPIVFDLVLLSVYLHVFLCPCFHVCSYCSRAQRVQPRWMSSSRPVW